MTQLLVYTRPTWEETPVWEKGIIDGIEQLPIWKLAELMDCLQSLGKKLMITKDNY